MRPAEGATGARDHSRFLCYAVKTYVLAAPFLAQNQTSFDFSPFFEANIIAFWMLTTCSVLIRFT